MRVFILALSLVACICVAQAQPLLNPFTFTFDADLNLDSGLANVRFEKAGARGKVELTSDGHLGFADGTRLRIVGTNLQWSGQWPDSSNAVDMARRFRALGINCVRFATFDYASWWPVSILADGQSSTANGLHVEQMKKFDWFMNQLRENGVYYVFTFHSAWQPRADDGIRQPDSLGWGARMPLIFDAQVQKVHRTIMGMLLRHVNQFTGVAYKDDPALAYIVAAEDASMVASWLYTQNVVRPNSDYAINVGQQHLAHMDSLWIAWLRKKGYTTDAGLNQAWSTFPASTANLLRNGGFEDPFSAAWQLGVNTNNGAQAILQLSDADKVEGSSSARIRINSIDDQKQVFGITLFQLLSELKRLDRYQVSFWAKTTPARGTRTITLYTYNGTFPYNGYSPAVVVTLTSEWKQLTYTFTSQATDESSANMSFLLGGDTGDVFLDDVQIREIPTSGLFAGESIERSTVPRSLITDSRVSATRYKDNSNFHYEQLRSFFLSVRRFVRDTLKSQVLMCPSTRLTSFYELHAAREYDVFSATEWRNSANSMLRETGGGSISSAASSRIKGKAFVMSHVAVAYPRHYQSDMMTIFPAYSGLQDWDGVFLGIFTQTARAGAAKVDSNSYWPIYSCPNLLTLFPNVASMIRNADVATSAKEIVVDNTREVIDQPRFHVTQGYSLGTGADSRMPLFRRVSMNPEFANEESLLPHRDISALSGQVDIAALNGENDQIFWDATKGTLRVQTPRTVTVSGGSVGQITILPSMILEQTSSGSPATISISSLTDNPIVESERSLLVISSRAQNVGTQYDPTTGDFTRWGAGPMQMEGVTMRITITAPLFDSLRIVPLSNEGRPKGTSKVIARGTGGRFSATLNTQQDETPWYQLEFVRTATSVNEERTSTEIRVHPNPVSDGRLVVGFPQGANIVRVFDVTGAERVRKNVDGTTVSIDVSMLPAGSYLISLYNGIHVVGTSTVVVR